MRIRVAGTVSRIVLDSLDNQHNMGRSSMDSLTARKPSDLRNDLGTVETQIRKMCGDRIAADYCERCVHAVLVHIRRARRWQAQLVYSAWRRNVAPEVNDQQWENQKNIPSPGRIYRIRLRTPGICGMRSTSILCLYLISLIVLEDVDPNRVYPIVFAGGDGVCGARMATALPRLL